jgi:hypothetical protein
MRPSTIAIIMELASWLALLRGRLDRELCHVPSLSNLQLSFFPLPSFFSSITAHQYHSWILGVNLNTAVPFSLLFTCCSLSFYYTYPNAAPLAFSRVTTGIRVLCEEGSSRFRSVTRRKHCGVHVLERSMSTFIFIYERTDDRPFPGVC